MRRATPCWCMAQLMSVVTTAAAPESTWSCTLSWPMRTDTGSSNTEKVPPKPQHSSGRRSFASCTPFTADSSVTALLNGSMAISLVLAVFRPRKVLQPRCSATLCGNSAQGNSRTPSTSCRKLTSSTVRERTWATCCVSGCARRCSRTWCVQLPEGATTWSKLSKLRTKSASVSAASAWQPLLAMGWPQQVWFSG